MTRPIDRRYVPPVSGVDLMQALNYIEMDDAGEDFIYGNHTSRKLFYTVGSRPVLERTARLAADGARSDLQKARALAAWVSGHVKWAGYYLKDKEVRLPENKSPTEEQMISLGYGWCNEQARLFCLLTQICGVPSRIVFAGNPTKGYGHCVSEVMIGEDWMMVDQSFGHCFEINGAVVRASRVYSDPSARAFFSPVYKSLCARLLEDLGAPCLEKDFKMAVADDPLDGFSNLGYINYFAL